MFFSFLIACNPIYSSYKTNEFTLDDLDNITPVDIEEYLEYLKVYTDTNGNVYKNDSRGLHRKLSALRSFYAYYYKHEMIKSNPTLLVDMPKLRDKEIIRLDYDEVAKLLDLVEHGGDNLTGMKKVYYEKNRIRNLAIFTLFLGTGIRVSECVGLNINDIDFSNTIETKEERKKANIDESIRRLKSFTPRRLAKHIARKTVSNYGNGMFGWGQEAGSLY